MAPSNRFVKRNIWMHLWPDDNAHTAQSFFARSHGIPLQFDLPRRLSATALDGHSNVLRILCVEIGSGYPTAIPASFSLFP